MTTGSLIALGVIVASIGAAVALTLLAKRLIRRTDRRSPLSGKLHHVPGQQLLDRIAGLNDEIGEALLMMLFCPIILSLVWFASRLPPDQLRAGAGFWVYPVAMLAVLGWYFRKLLKLLESRRRFQDGLAAERMTAQQLNRLIGPECMVLHDVPGDGFNLDHVVISARAVYAVETKSFRKPKAANDGEHFKVSYDGNKLVFPDWATSAPIAQARRQAQWLQKWLRESLNTEIPVVPAVALPGWWIDLGKESGSSDVRVFTPMGRGAHFMLGGPQALAAPQRALIAQALALRYPDAGE